MSIPEQSYGVIPVYYPTDGQPRYLIVISESGHWSFPKGHHEEGSTPIETAKRELEEEAGVTNADIRTETIFTSHYSFTRHNGEVVTKTTTLFLGFLNAPIDTDVTPHTSAFGTYNEIRPLFEYEDNRRILDEAHNAVTELQKRE